MTVDDIFLTIVIPCYNEERNIRLGALENVSSYLRRQKYPAEVIIVDDGSNDDSSALLKKISAENNNFIYLKKRHQGKAAAVTAGVLKARGRYILFSDLDQATPINQLEKLFPYLHRPQKARPKKLQRDKKEFGNYIEKRFQLIFRK
ncbi:MAG: Glycosyl transferase, family 2, partial [Candidatus Gottesmanbacteria bacterium GW2011_GWC2_42_8]